MCGMQVNGSDSALYMKYAGNKVFFQLYKLGSSSLRNRNSRLAETGQRSLSDDRGWQYDRGHPHGLCRVFRKGRHRDRVSNRLTDTKAMQIGFDQGTEKPFNVVMLDSRDAVKTSMDYAKVIDTPTPQPSAQPAKGPQPFSAKKAGDCNSEDVTVGTPAPPLPPELRAPCTRRDDGSI